MTFTPFEGDGQDFASGQRSVGRPLLAWVAGPDLVSRWQPLLEQLRWAFDLLVIGSDSADVDALGKLGYNAHLRPFKRGIDPLGDLGWLRHLRSDLARWQPEIVLFADTKPSTLGPVAGRFARVPVVARLVTGMGTLGSYSTRDVLRRRRLHHLIFRGSRIFADLTIFQTQDSYRRWRRQGLAPKGRSLLVPGLAAPVPPPAPKPRGSMFRLAVRQRLGLPDACEIVLMHGRLTRSKGIQDLLGTIPLVRGQRPNCRFVVAGWRDPGALDRLSDEELTELQRHALWLGDELDADDLFLAADVFVYPSYYREGVPRALLRAASYELPIVAVDSEPCRQVVEHGETGLLVPRRRPARLAAAIQELLQDPARAKLLGQQAKLLVAENFDLQSAVQTLQSTLMTALQSVGYDLAVLQSDNV